MLKVGLSTLLFAAAALGLAAFYLEWTGDGRGIDYIRPTSRFQSGYNLPLPLTIMAVGAAVGLGGIFIGGVASLVDPKLTRSAIRWLGGIGGFAVVTFTLAAHGGYLFWIFWNDGGVGVFRSEDWGPGIWVAMVSGSLALVATVLHTRLLKGGS